MTSGAVRSNFYPRGARQWIADGEVDAVHIETASGSCNYNLKDVHSGFKTLLKSAIHSAVKFNKDASAEGAI